MGTIRNGARTFLNVIAQACRLSRLPGFRTGLVAILGSADATELLGVWEPFCTVVDNLIALDNWYNKKDHSDETLGDVSEDEDAVF